MTKKMASRVIQIKNLFRGMKREFQAIVIGLVMIIIAFSLPPNLMLLKFIIFIVGEILLIAGFYLLYLAIKEIERIINQQ